MSSFLHNEDTAAASLDHEVSSSSAASRQGSVIESVASDTPDIPDSQQDVVRVLLERTASYSRLMHAHTKSQMIYGTVPSYQKTMRSFHSAQLADKSQTKRSVTASQVSGSSDGVIPATLPVLKMKLDEAPENPTNTPVSGQTAVLNENHQLPSSRRRSATDPVPRGFLIEKSRHTVLV